MASIIAKIIIFTLLINIGAGLISLAVVTTDESGNAVNVFGSGRGGTAGELGDETFADDFTGTMQQELQPSGGVEDKENLIVRILDTMRLGFVYRFVNFIPTIFYGIVDIMDVIIGQYLAENVQTFLFGGELRFGLLKMMLTIGYVLFAIELLIGIKIVPEST